LNVLPYSLLYSSRYRQQLLSLTTDCGSASALKAIACERRFIFSSPRPLRHRPGQQSRSNEAYADVIAMNRLAKTAHRTGDAAAAWLPRRIRWMFDPPRATNPTSDPSPA